MNEEAIKQLFSVLRRIEPTRGFMEQSKAKISLASQEQPSAAMPARLRFGFFESLTTTGAIGLASILLVIGLGSFSYLTGSNDSGNSFNNDVLITEAKSADFQLQIKEVTYFDESAKQVALALDKIAEQDETPDNLQ